ncbi:hypothetical protein H257_01448 [Aphanomyces astaci]|uniref:Uncharacterized protein n=1 Tax=Aphanomyces astaci TaxID=112090 RepID=W4H877_APHAT|nr:hypothetical protein H257_01448 [Aphanomyces astaci]ETV88087.1 hypothetical protein H257_01448 [Aphanomyces astaci]|eukprot:XP_009822950.1 hypothetical protein H257_01448 [Aphanomyces astaci]
MEFQLMQQSLASPRKPLRHLLIPPTSVRPPLPPRSTNTPEPRLLGLHAGSVVYCSTSGALTVNG